MKIKKLHIVQFGKFSDYTLNLSDGFQVLHGNNEDGKSTIMSFLMLMFYSNQGRVQRIEDQPRKKYLPWNGSPMEGALEFSDHGINYQLTKVFGDTPSKDKTTLLNKDTGETVPLGKNQEIGEYFFGLDLAAFKRSSYINQIGALDAGGSGDMVAEKLISNLVSSGDEDISGQDVLERLEKASIDLVSRSRKKGRLAEAQQELSSLEEEKQQTKFQLESQKEVLEAYQQQEQILREKQSLEKMITGYQANQSKQQLNSLLQLQQQVAELKARLTSPNYSYDTMEHFLKDAKNQFQEYKDTEKTIESLEDSLAGHDTTDISGEEFQKAQTLTNHIGSIEKIVTQWESRIYPQWNALLEKQKELQSLQSELNACTYELDKAKPEQQYYEELSTTLGAHREESAEVSKQLEAKQLLWQDQRQLKKERLTHAEERAKEAKKPASKALPIVLFILLAVVGAGTYFLNILPLVGAMAIVAVSLVLLLITLFRKNAPDGADDREQFRFLQEEYNQWKETIQKEESALINRQAELEQLLLKGSKDQADLGAHLPLWNTLEEKSRTLSQALQEESRLVENTQNSILTMQQQLREDYPSAEFQQVFADFPQDIKHLNDNISSSLLGLQTSYSSQLLGLFSSKEVQNMEELQKKYMAFQAQANTRNALATQKERLETLRTTFVAHMSSHTPTNGFEAAVELYNSLFLAFNMCVQKETAITNKSAGMGVEDCSIGALEQSLQLASSQAVDYEVQDLDALKQKLAQLDAYDPLTEMRQLQGQMQPTGRNMEEIQKEIRELSEQIAEMEHYYNSLQIAQEVMTESQEEMRQSFGPMLNQLTSEIFSQLTGERYSEVLVAKDYDVKVKSGVHFREWQYLSNGTIDQVYLALRLAIAKLISPSSPLPIFLDDVFIQYDDKRALLALEFLKQYSQEQDTQILLFSCHNRMTDMANQFDIPARELIEQ